MTVKEATMKYMLEQTQQKYILDPWPWLFELVVKDPTRAFSVKAGVVQANTKNLDQVPKYFCVIIPLGRSSNPHQEGFRRAALFCSVSLVSNLRGNS